MVIINDELALWIEEDGIVRVEQTLAKWHQQAEKSYEEQPDLEHRSCYLCGQLMRAGSMSYYEGYHFDSCY